MPGARELQCGLAVSARDAVVVFEAEVQTDELADVLLVFDNENSRARGGRGFHRHGGRLDRRTLSFVSVVHPSIPSPPGDSQLTRL